MNLNTLLSIDIGLIVSIPASLLFLSTTFGIFIACVLMVLLMEAEKKTYIQARKDHLMIGPQQYL